MLEFCRCLAYHDPFLDLEKLMRVYKRSITTPTHVLSCSSLYSTFSYRLNSILFTPRYGFLKVFNTMKIAVVAALAAPASGQTPIIDLVPSCGQSCLRAAVQSQTSCNLADPYCICEDVALEGIRGSSNDCIFQQCSDGSVAGMPLSQVQVQCPRASLTYSPRQPQSSLL